jgi:hypothetical protein
VVKHVGTTASVSINNGTPATNTWALDGNQDIAMIGSRGGPVNFFDGIIRNLKIWTGGDRTTGTLARYYKLNEQTGTTITDFTGSGNDGSTVNITDSERDLFRLSPDGTQWINRQWPNLLRWSEAFDNAVWGTTEVTVLANDAIAPNGAMTADKLVANTNNSLHFLSQYDADPTKDFSYTVYAKAVGYNYLYFSGVGTGNCIFNVSTGAVESTSTWFDVSIVDAGNGWYKCVASVTPSNTNKFRINVADNNSGVSFTGDGTSGIYIWGAQLEEGSTATTYRKTEAVAGRALEVA